MQSAVCSVGARVPTPPRITGSQGEPNFYELASKNVGFAPPAKTLRAVQVGRPKPVCERTRGARTRAGGRLVNLIKISYF